jgi:murein DD-endopeptidase MepM/ murein hydrolase activator NlpD
MKLKNSSNVIRIIKVLVILIVYVIANPVVASAQALIDPNSGGLTFESSQKEVELEVPTPTTIPDGAFLPSSVVHMFADDQANGSAAIRGKTSLRKSVKKDLKAEESATIVVDNISLEEVDVQLFDFNGQELDPNFEVVSDKDPLIIKMQHGKQFKPGRYRVLVKDTADQTYTQDFTWGVLAVNTSKAFYASGDEASIQMAVLDETGEMVCNADLTLRISAPGGVTEELTSQAGEIIVNPQCYTKDMTVIPDYQAVYKTGAEGEYTLELTATTPDGTYTVSDSFTVKSSTLFSVERSSATRIYPPNTYPVTFTITANQDFTGEVRETVPASFGISKGSTDAVGRQFDTIKQQSAAKESDVLGAEMFNIGKPFKGDHSLTLGFGRQHRDPTVGQKYTDFHVLGHDGVDFDLPMRTPVIAVDDGKVVRAGDGDYGVTSVIEHSWGKSYYGHLDMVIKPEGSEVKKGEIIALSGNTGLSSGPHLHFGIKPDKNDVENGYFGKINPLPFLSMEDNGAEHGKVAGVSTMQQDVKDGVQVLTWNVSLKKGETVKLGYLFNAPLISPELYLLGPLMITDEGKSVFTENRQWQIAADAVVMSGGIVSSEAQFGGLQRKVAYVNSNWYAFYNDGTDVFYKKSADGITWGSAVNLDANEDNDADNYNPSIDVSSNRYIHVAYLDESADQVQMLTLDTNTDTTPQTSVCALTSPGAFSVSTYMVSVASLSDATAVVAYADTSSDTNVDIFEVGSLTSASCTSTDVQPGNMPFGTQGSGITAGDRPVLVGLTSTTAMMVYQDGSNLKSAMYDASFDEWTNNNTLIAAVADSTYSVTTDGTSVWVLTQNGSTATRLYSCCTTDFASTTIDSDTGANDQDGLSDVDIFCPTADNCKIVYTDDIDTAAPLLRFVDCNDEACSSPTVTTLDTDLGDAGDQAGASIYCVSDGSPVDGGDNCKVVYGTLLGGNSSDLIFVDCTNDEDCSTNTKTTIDADMASGNDTSMVHTSIYCPSDTNCKFVYNSELTTDIIFVDCPDATCTSTGRVATILDGTYGTGGTQVAPYMDMYCVASDNCKIVYHDNNATSGCADANSLCFVDCTADEDCSTNTQTVLDSDIGTTLGASPMAINCVGGDTECTIVYGDGTDIDLTFVDCEGSATCASGSTITDIDTTGGADTGLTKKVSLDCTANTDCKIFYVGEITPGSEDAYFVDCDNETCTTGSVYDLPTDARFGGAVECLTTSNCKLAYYAGTSATPPALTLGDCDTEDCLPTWTSLTAPWTSETNITSISLTYDSTNTDLIANIIKDASEQAYYSVSDATSISWGTSTAYEFTAGDLDNISSPETAAGTSLMGVLLRQAANIEFDLFATSGPTLDQLMRHGAWFNGGAEQPFTF